jgi:tetratricopeptide (TPR) repeat protein
VLTIVVSLLSGLLVGGLLRVSGAVHSIAGTILPAVAVTLVAAVLLLRRLSGRIEPLVSEAQRHMQGGRRELALKSLRSGLWLGRWHPLIEGQLRTQIGVLEYAMGNVDTAISELSRASSRPWEGPAFLGCAHFKKRNEGPMVKAFERAVKVAPKEGLAWTLYAWCLNARGKKDEAVAILKRGLEKIPGDQRLQNNIELVQQGKKLKVAPYGDTWTAFGLDGATPAGPTNLPKYARGYAQRPGFRQRPQRKR